MNWFRVHWFDILLVATCLWLLWNSPSLVDMWRDGGQYQAIRKTMGDQ